MDYDEIDIELLLQMNLDTYVNWVLSVKADGYRPTKDTIDNFAIWRKNSYDSWMSIFESRQAGNPLPIKMIADNLGAYICEKMPHDESILLACIYDCLFTNKHYELAYLVGKLDFLKWLHLTYSAEVLSPIKKTDSSTPRVSGSDFPLYLTARGILILAGLKTRYSNKKPKDLATMIAALKKKGLVIPGIDSNVAKLRRDLADAFSMSGTDSAFKKQMKAYGDPGAGQDVDIEAAIRHIDTLLNNLSS